MQRRSEPADADVERVEGSAAQLCAGPCPERQSAGPVEVRPGSDEPHQPRGMATAPPVATAAQGPSIAAAAPAGDACETSADAAVLQCLRRMAAAGDGSEVVFLGTGCAEPSKHRGASGILLRSDPDRRVLHACMVENASADNQHRGSSWVAARVAQQPNDLLMRTVNFALRRQGLRELAEGQASRQEMRRHAVKLTAAALHDRLASGGGILMDAGEGVYGQMARLWGARTAAAQAAALAAVLVSHKHADHVLGIPALLAARPRDSPPLVIVGAHKLVGVLKCHAAGYHPSLGREPWPRHGMN